MFVRKEGVGVSVSIPQSFETFFSHKHAHAKSWLVGKDSDAGRDWGQEEKGTTEDEMAGWHHWLDGRESQWTPGVGDGQRGLACCDSWGCKESDWATDLISDAHVGGASGEEPTRQCRRPNDEGSIPGWGRSPGGGHGNRLDYSCLENTIDRGTWQATVYMVTKSRTPLKWLSTHTWEITVNILIFM